jgi:hypothetical protein
MTSALEGVDYQHHAPAALPSRKTRYPLYRRLAVCEIILKNVVGPEKSQLTVWRMRISHWISKAKNAHSEYVILNDFPLKQ